MVLNEKQLIYGYDYYFKNENRPKSIVEVSEYNGESAIIINCTQLDDSSNSKYKTAKARKNVVNERCDFLIKNPTAFTELTFCTRMPQELFNAVCSQQNLKKLYIKWGVYPDISKISNLVNLEFLHLGLGSSVGSIEPISKLENLVALTVENFQKIDDYSPLTKLKKLESLTIEGDCFAPKNIHIDSIDFLKDMKQLRFFRFFTSIVKSKDYTPLLSLENIEHLSIKPFKEVNKLYDEIIKLPKLKYGTIVFNPEFYKK